MVWFATNENAKSRLLLLKRISGSLLNVLGIFNFYFIYRRIGYFENKVVDAVRISILPYESVF